jgi:membrane protein required for beta-lactamase induction
MGISMASRPSSKAIGYGIATLAVVLLLFQLGYGAGKNMAHRDNALQASRSAAGA